MRSLSVLFFECKTVFQAESVKCESESDVYCRGRNSLCRIPRNGKKRCCPASVDKAFGDIISADGYDRSRRTCRNISSAYDGALLTGKEYRKSSLYEESPRCPDGSTAENIGKCSADCRACSGERKRKNACRKVYYHIAGMDISLSAHYRNLNKHRQHARQCGEHGGGNAAAKIF